MREKVTRKCVYENYMKEFLFFSEKEKLLNKIYCKCNDLKEYNLIELKNLNLIELKELKKKKLNML